MKDKNKTKAQLIDELTELRLRIAELEAIETERQQTQEALRASEELYRTLVNDSVLGMAINIPGETIVFGNRRLAEITGYSQAEYQSPQFNFMSLFLKEDHKSIVAQVQKRLAGETIAPYEVRLITKEQKIKWVEVHNVLTKYKGKNAIQVQLLDITDHKQLKEALEHSQEQLQSIIDESPQVIFIKDLPKSSLSFCSSISTSYLPSATASAILAVPANF